MGDNGVISGVFKINSTDYSKYLKQKTGLRWSRENTNDEDAGRDMSETMHTNVTSHQRKLEVKMGPMMLDEVMQLEADLQSGDNGVTVEYPDLKDGIVKRLFYNTSINAGLTQFVDEGVRVDDITFNLITIKEDVITDD